jgi:hypothetical protein
MYIRAHQAAWRDPRHAQHWRSSLDRYVVPTLGDMAVSVIDTSNVMRILEPLWREKTETASRVRGRTERVRRGHDGPEATREITDPLFGIDGETFERFASCINDPATPIDMKIDAIGARRREVEALPPIEARYALRVVLAAHALAGLAAVRSGPRRPHATMAICFGDPQGRWRGRRGAAQEP